MANVIVSTFTNLPGGILDSFRQGFVDALIGEGNNVLLFKTNSFLKDYHSSNCLAENIDKHLLIAAIKAFNPDFVMSMNHSGLFPGFADAIDCPIGIWLLDGPAYLVDPNECRRQASRYHVFTTAQAFRADLTQSFGMSNNKIHDLPFASDFRSYASHAFHNISFIGTNFTGLKLQEIIKKYRGEPKLIAKVYEFIKSYDNDIEMLFTTRLKKYDLESIFMGDFDEAYILNTISINKRIKVLDAIEDLGLALYGTADWPETIKYSVGLALSFDPRPILTKSDLECIYNASKISLNISHLQARGGLPWRIFDVMACNSALISDYQEDFNRLFGKNIGIPFYKSPSEARTLCEQLLKDESHRRFIVESSNQVINSAHRFKHRLETLSENLDINLLTNRHGSLVKLNTEDFQQHNKIASPLNLQTGLSYSGTDGSIKQFSLQLFQSTSLDFKPDNSTLLNISPSQSNEIDGVFEIVDSMPFFRLDIGEYFSQHTNVEIEISLTCKISKNGYKSHFVDLAKDILQFNEFYCYANELCCGFDSFCVFENPFPDKDIKLHFKSVLKMGI